MTEDSFDGFSPSLFTFLEEIAVNNNREWFHANKSRYEVDVREPAFHWIRAMKPRLQAISPCFLAVARKVGGSMMRIHRDVRFSKNKEPYKTNVGIQFRHVLGKDVHAPGYYLHISPESNFLGVGIWRPDSSSLAKIRASIHEHQEDWVEMRDDEGFQELFELGGDSLKRSPRGYDKDHPLLVDLKRKDFIAVHNLTPEDLLDEHFIDHASDAFAAATPFMEFLCESLEVGF